MTMESPVRIYIGAALVVNLLLLSSTLVSGNTLPHETTSTTVKDERNIRYSRINGTSWMVRQNDKNTETPSKEPNSEETVSEEHTEKNAKYKHRGRVRYNPQVKSTTETILRRARTSSTEATNVIIVTPTPEVMKPAQIIDSMRTYKRTKMPVKSTTPSTSASPSTSTVAPISIIKKESESQSEEEDEYEDDEEEDKESFEKYTANDFESNFFTIPSYNDDFDFSKHSNPNKKVKEPYSSPSFGGFSTFFPSFGPKKSNNDHDSYKSESFFSDFESELTTPKNDFFDKKYEEISKSIQKNLASIKATEQPTNTTNVHKIVKENIGLGMRGNDTPTNKSTVYIKNTKEIRVLDNEGASSANSGLSDVQGTSIYYEMSVLSTETYAIDNSDDDCDNDTMHLDPTISTSTDEELASLKAPQTTLLQGSPSKPTYPDPSTNSVKPSSESTSGPNKRIYVSPNSKPTKSAYTDSSPSPNKPILISSKPTSAATKPTYPDPSSESISTLSSNYLSVSSLVPAVYNSASPIPISTQNVVNSVSSTEKAIKVFSSSYTRNRSYSKRLNLNGTNDSLNSVTSRAETTVAPSNKPLTRRFYQTTPKTRPYWMTPRRNVTRISPTRPTTIYSEHFNIRDRFSTTSTTTRPIELISNHNKTTLTTVSSDIDPVLQIDIGGIEKVVHSPSIADNSIPSVWKRGSTKYMTSTVSSAETGGINELEIPPTLTAWALASLRSPPSLPSAVVNSTTIPKSIDENELQKVGDVTDKKETIIRSTSTTTAHTLNNDIEPKKVVEEEQNRLPWRPIFAPTPTKSETSALPETTQTKPERQPAESIISAQTSLQETVTTESTVVETVVPTTEILNQTTKQTWVPVTSQLDKTTTESLPDYVKVLKIISPSVATNVTLKGFESITKLPSGLTTPQDETVASSEQKTLSVNEELPTTTDYEITTIRFSYVPTEETTENNGNGETETTTTTTTWHAVFPTRTKITTIKDAPVTTYRPVYMTTTDLVEETTTVLPETSPSPTEATHESETVTERLVDTTETITQATTTTSPTTSSPITSTQTTATEEPSTESVLETTSQKLLPVDMSTSTSVQTTTPPETTSIVTEIITEINTEIQSKPMTTETPTTTEITDTPPSDLQESDCTSEENIDSNEIITKDTTKSTTTAKITTEVETTTKTTTPETKFETTQEVTTTEVEETTARNGKIYDTTTIDDTSVESTTDIRSTETGDEGEFTRDMTTEAIPRVAGETEEAGSGAAVAIAVSTIGVIALILLIGLLLVVRRRGRRGVYAQRCTPVSLDAYSLDSVSVGHRKGNHRLRASKRSYGNPAYDDEVTSHPMQYAALANFALDVESMTAEFAEIPSVTVRPDEVPPGCEDKNRYSNVLPLPETRVPLKRIGNDPTTEYINANFITGPGNIKNYYIACQAPLSNTVVDFWRMIWEQNSRIIVMLTEYMENGVEKCYEYLPPSEISDNKRTFGEYQIILKKREQRDKYAISTVQLVNLATRTWREVTHLWFFWPAKGVPDDYDAIIDFLSEMRSYMKISQTAKEYDEEGVEVIYGDQNRSSFGNLSKLRSDDSGSGNGMNVYSPAKAEEQMRRGNVTNGTLGRMKAASEIEGVRPCVVTCASGAGRAAALIAVDVCARALAAGAADVPRVVRELRAQRPHSLSNRHHYIFLYKVLSEYGNKLMGGGVDTI